MVKRYTKVKIPYYNKKTGKIESEIAPKNNYVSEETLDKWFSKFIRLRDALDNGYVRCVTCNAIHHWKQMDNGHFITRHQKHINTKYHEQNCHAQCTGCNNFGKGEQYKHGLYIDKRYGEGASLKLYELAISPIKIKLGGYEITEMAEIYRKKTNELLKTIGK